MQRVAKVLTAVMACTAVGLMLMELVSRKLPLGRTALDWLTLMVKMILSAVVLLAVESMEAVLPSFLFKTVQDALLNQSKSAQ